MIIDKKDHKSELKPKVVFFGSGPVAAKSLELLAKDFEIEAVVTKPKPEHHHGSFPVLDIAETLGLYVHTVSNKAELSALVATKPFTSQVGVLIDFGIIVAQDTIDYFPKGIVNSHFSLLPEWRGADPITFSILSGQKQTGVSLMLLVEKMDEGPLLSQTPVDIAPDATTGSLTAELIDTSNRALKAILPMWLNNETQPAPQEKVTVAASNVPTYSRKLTKEDGRIDWTKPAEVLEREIRAYAEWPKSYTKLASLDVIVTESHVSKTREDSLSMQTGEDFLVIDKLKPAGKNEMTAKEFLSGYGKNL